MVLESRALARASVGDSGPSPPSDEKLLRQIQDLKSMLVQRDNEISVLVNMVKQGKTADDVGGARGSDKDRDVYSIEPDHSTRHTNADSRARAKAPPLSMSEQKLQRERAREDKIIQRHLFGVPPPSDPRIFDDAAG